MVFRFRIRSKDGVVIYSATLLAVFSGVSVLTIIRVEPQKRSMSLAYLDMLDAGSMSRSRVRTVLCLTTGTVRYVVVYAFTLF